MSQLWDTDSKGKVSMARTGRALESPMHEITHVQPLKGRRLQVTFSDDITVVLEMDQVLKRGYGDVFSPLMDEAYFAKVRVDSELDTIVWPNYGADVCPDVLYSHSMGEPILFNGTTMLN